MRPILYSSHPIRLEIFFRVSDNCQYLHIWLCRKNIINNILNSYENQTTLLIKLWQRAKGRISNPAKHLSWSAMRKYLTAKSRQLFSQNAPFYMFDSVLNKPLGRAVKSAIWRLFCQCTKFSYNKFLESTIYCETFGIFA